MSEESLEATIRTRGVLQQQILDSLRGMTRDMAMCTIMSYLSIDDLREIVPTICREEPQA